MVNFSKEKRQKMLLCLDKLKQEYLNNDEMLADLSEIESELIAKKYGLIWEEHNEDIENIMLKNFLVFNEVIEKEINNSNSLENNFLLEGDNLHCLYLLEKTHKENIDLIYIDPPYNMGERDFIYNDSYVNKDDGYIHSKWLSFMSRRLTLAKNLLNNTGIIFISIDDHELANLKLLCDEIFGENNFIANCFVLDNLKGKANDNFITSVGSRLLVYAKNKALNNYCFNKIENIFADKIENKYIDEDENGFYQLITFKKTGQSKYREDRQYMFYPILQKNGKLYPITQQEFESLYDKENKKFNDNFIEKLKLKYKDYEFILPVDSNGTFLRWTSGFNTFLKEMNKDIVYSNGVKQKKRPKAAEMLQCYASGTPKSLMYKTEYSMGTEELKRIVGENDFNFPKSVTLMMDILKLIPNKNAIVLDFFAGSGTMGQAVLQLNKEDCGNRKFILCTNNENQICEKITYDRCKTIITGNKKDGSYYSDGISANLKYYKTDFISRDKETISEELCKHIKEMVQLEHMVKIDNLNYILLLNDDEADKLEKEWDKYQRVKGIYISKNVLLTASQNKLFKNVEIKVIPDYYFNKELKEIGEIW